MSRPRRTCLFMSANKPGFIMAANIMGADQVIFDLENAVPLHKKIEARYMLKESLKFTKATQKTCGIDGRTELVVRVNAPNGPFIDDDLEQICPSVPDAIRVPMVSGPSDIEALDEIVTRLELKHGIEAGKIKFQPMIETPKAFLNIKEIISSSERINAIALGGEDYCGNSGIMRSSDWSELDYVRNVIITTAVAFKIDALDTVYMDFKDIDGLIRDTERIKRMGFMGRAIINPSQIAIVKKIFTPSPEKVEQTKQMLEEVRYVSVNNKNLWVKANGEITDEAYIYQQYRTIINSGEYIGTFERFLSDLKRQKCEDTLDKKAM